MTLLTLVHEHFDLTIECTKFDGIWEKAKRNVGEDNLTCKYTWSEGVKSVELNSEDAKDSITKDVPARAIFFDNTDYPIWVDFREGVTGARFASDLQADNDRFSYHQRGRILSGFLNFGNDIGRSEIRLQYELAGKREEFCLGFEVLSTKLNYHEHWQKIVEDIEAEYRILTLDYMRRTFHGFDPDTDGERPDLVWWSIFKGEQEKFIKAVRSIIDRPRHRLHGVSTFQRADKLKRLTPWLENELAEHRTEPGHLYHVEERTPSNDTLENRFLKHALNEITAKYEKLKAQVESVNQGADTLHEQMDKVQKDLNNLKHNPFFRTIGRFKGFSQESLVLQKATGYSQVFRTWNLLRRAYSLRDGLYRLQTKDIATLYEIWCFIEVSHIVKDQLKIEDKDIDHRNRTEMSGLFTWELGKGEHSRILFRKDGKELAELVYNPKHTERENDNISMEHLVVPTVPQKPDIVLQLRKDDVERGMKMTYLFDAKYRIGGRTADGVDTPPDDAINQMHRYRDAIYYRDHKSDELKKEVIGGYILFPGDGDTADVEVSKFYKTIEEVNIGAFPLRPKDERNRKLLEEFIAKLIDDVASDILSDSIPQKGLFYNEGDPLYFVAEIISRENDKAALLNGTATSFHCGNKGPREDVDIRKLRYLAPVKDNRFHGYYKIESVSTHEVADEKYPIRLEFKLSAYTPLETPVKYGIHALSARGVPFTKNDFTEYCKQHPAIDKI